MVKTYPTNFRNFYLINTLYGGYSYDDAPNIYASVSYASPEAVLKTAELHNINEIHLAGFKWQEIGEQGLGQVVSLQHAKELLQKLKENEQN